MAPPLFRPRPTTKSEWWPGGPWEHGDPFPLPLPPVARKCHGAPRYAAQRHARHAARQRLANEAVSALNHLAAVKVLKSAPRRTSPGPGRPTALQSDMLDDIRRRVTAVGPPPDDLDERRALTELLASKDFYSEVPHNLAGYDPAKLRVSKGDVVPKDAIPLLPAEAAGYLRHFRTQIERSSEDIEQRAAEGLLPEPYWDPTLKSDKSARHDLFRNLQRLNILSFRKSIKARVGLFFVHKKDSNIRLIVDGRQASACHHKPPRARLGGPRALAEIDLSDETLTTAGGFGGISEIAVHASGADVKDSFFQFSLRPLASWFGIDELVTASDFNVTSVWDDESESMVPVEAGDRLYPVFEAMSMGWSWSLYFCNEAITDLATCSPSSQLVQDKEPVPTLQPGRPLAAIYVDNLTAIGGTRSDSIRACEEFEHIAAERGLSIHEPDRGMIELESLGLILDFRNGRRLLRHKPRRIWKFRLASHGLLSRRVVRGEELQVWLGHATCIASLTPELLSILQHSYRFVEDRWGSWGRLPGAVRQEVRLFASLCLLSEVAMDAPMHPLVHVGDSSTNGYALLYGRMPVAACVDAARWKERWRFIEVENATEVHHPSASWAETLGGLSPLGGPGPLAADGEPIPAPPGLDLPEPILPCFAPAHVRPGQPTGEGRHTAYGKYLDSKPSRSSSSRKGFVYRRQKAGKLVETAIGIPPLAPMWEERHRWRTAFEGRWQFPQEHINVKEMRVCGMAMRRAVRSGGVVGTRMLFLTDNLTAACSLEKGRARSWALNGVCRRVAAYTLGCSIRARWRYIESERNVADEGSRRPLVGRSHPRAPSVLPSAVSHTPDASSPSAPSSLPLPSPPPLRPRTRLERELIGDPATPADSAPQLQCGPSERIALELFSGTARLTSALSRAKLRTGFPFDVKLGREFDLTRRDTQRLLLSWIRSGLIWYIHFGTPCSIWSQARKGVTNLERAKAKNLVGVELALFTSQAVRECHRCGVLWSIENPATSRLFTFPPIARLAGLGNARWVQWDMCMYGADHRKRTLLLTNLPELDRLGCDRKCNHAYRHTPLAGTCRVIDDDGRAHWVNRTSLAGAYPEELCADWASLVASVAPAGSFGPEPSWLNEWKVKFHAAAEHGARRPRQKSRRAGPRLDLRLDVTKADADEACALAERYLTKHTPAYGNTSASEVRKIEAAGDALPCRRC